MTAWVRAAALFAVLGLGMGSLLAADLPPPMKSATAVKLEGVIKLDGKLDDAIWRKAPVHTGFEWPLQAAARPVIPEDRQTFFQVAYDANTLYLGLRMNEPDMAHLKPF